MRKARRQKTLGKIVTLEKALRNIGLLGTEIEIEGTNISISDFLHALYHTVKTAGKQGNADVLKECNICGEMVSSSVVHNDVRVCENCVRSRKMWHIIPSDKLREAGWIV